VKTDQIDVAEPAVAPPHWLVLLLATATGLTVGNIYHVQPLLTVIERAFRVGVTAAGEVVTAAQVGYVAGMLLLVPPGDRRSAANWCRCRWA
jgi:predicted MFS family arabinose efflux permease